MSPFLPFTMNSAQNLKFYINFENFTQCSFENSLAKLLPPLDTLRWGRSEDVQWKLLGKGRIAPPWPQPQLTKPSYIKRLLSGMMDPWQPTIAYRSLL